MFVGQDGQNPFKNWLQMQRMNMNLKHVPKQVVNTQKIIKLHRNSMDEPKLEVPIPYILGLYILGR